MSTAVPVLDARRGVESCDYPAAVYECRLTRRTSGGEATARHHLSGAPALEHLIRDGKARFAVEVRSAAAFASCLHIAEAGHTDHTVPIDGDDLAASGRQALPGLLAVEACPLPLSDCGEVWQRLGRRRVEAPAGHWLARAQHCDLLAPQHSLLRFVEAAEGTLERGRMRLDFRGGDGPIRYEVSLHKDDIAACRRDASQPAARAATLAAWTAALADAGTNPAFTGDDNGAREPVGVQLAAFLGEAGCSAPGDDDYDPVRAATELAGHEFLNFDMDGSE